MSNHLPITHIVIDGRELPVCLTMGAMVRYKELSGEDVSAIRDNDVTKVCMFFWCCVVSACKREAIDFNMSFIDFADRVTVDMMSDFTSILSAEKKTNP